MVSGEVFARRLAMGVSGIFDPANANHAELARLVPEKSDAAAASSLAMLERCGQLVEGSTRFMADEMALAARAYVSLASCRTPVAFAVAHQGLAFSWLARLTAQTGAISALAMHSQGDAMTPFHRAATSNSARLACD